MLKDIFSKAWFLLSSPTKAWQQITTDKTENNLSALRYLYTLLLLVVGASFFGSLLYKEGFHFMGALLKAIIVGISLFGSFWAIYYLLIYALKRYFHLLPDKQMCLELIVYSYTVIFIINIFTALVPSLFFLKIINAYTIYIVWEGVGAGFNFEEKERGNIVLLVSVAIIILPYIFQQILSYIFPITNF